MIQFRKIEPAEWPLVAEWWLSAGIEGFNWSDLPAERSFFAVVDDEPVLAVSLMLGESKIAWIEAFVGNPEFDCDRRQVTTKMLLVFLEGVAKDHGATKLFCMSPNLSLSDYYARLGFRKTGTVDTFIKEIV